MAERLWFGERSALVHRPDPEPVGPWPVLLMLHGAGGTAAWALEETRLDEMANRAGFLLVLPEGTRAEMDRPAGFLQNPQVWNDGSPRGVMGTPGVDDVAFVAKVLDAISREYPVDERRISVTGFSNGAGMAFRLGIELSERLAAIVPVSGYCWIEGKYPARIVPTLYLVGSHDPLVPLDGGEVTVPWGRVREDRPSVAETLERWARLQGLAGVQHRIIAGLGHHWPGGRGGLSRRIAGPTSNGVDGNEMVWEFCRRFRLEGGG